MSGPSKHSKIHTVIFMGIIIEHSYTRFPKSQVTPWYKGLDWLTFQKLKASKNLLNAAMDARKQTEGENVAMSSCVGNSQSGI